MRAAVRSRAAPGAPARDRPPPSSRIAPAICATPCDCCWTAVAIRSAASLVSRTIPPISRRLSPDARICATEPSVPRVPPPCPFERRLRPADDVLDDLRDAPGALPELRASAPRRRPPRSPCPPRPRAPPRWRRSSRARETGPTDRARSRPRHLLRLVEQPGGPRILDRRLDPAQALHVAPRPIARCCSSRRPGAPRRAPTRRGSRRRRRSARARAWSAPVRRPAAWRASVAVCALGVIGQPLGGAGELGRRGLSAATISLSRSAGS